MRVVGDGLESAVGVGDVVPADLVALLGVGLGVRLTTKTLAIEQQLHLVGIGIGDEVELAIRFSIPVVTHAVVARLDAVPYDIVLRVDDGDMHQRFVGFEERAHVIGLGLGFERDVEHALCPTLRGPTLTLAEVVDGAPVGETDDAVEVHLEVVLSHRGDRGLALVEGHPGETAPVAREVHIAIIIGLNVGLDGEVVGQGVGIPVTVTGMHGDGDETGGVVTLEQRLLQLVHRDAEIVERLVGVLLQLVSETP